jgi:hypothetical protein
MEQGPAGEANTCLAFQEIPSILRSPTVRTERHWSLA